MKNEQKKRPDATLKGITSGNTLAAYIKYMHTNYNTFYLEREIKMKKRRLKRWVVWLLTIISTLAFIIMASDCEDMSIFIISHIIATLVFVFCSYVLIKNMEV